MMMMRLSTKLALLAPLPFKCDLAGIQPKRVYPVRHVLRDFVNLVHEIDPDATFLTTNPHPRPLVTSTTQFNWDHQGNHQVHF